MSRTLRGFDEAFPYLGARGDVSDASIVSKEEAYGDHFGAIGDQVAHEMFGVIQADPQVATRAAANDFAAKAIEKTDLDAEPFPATAAGSSRVQYGVRLSDPRMGYLWMRTRGTLAAREVARNHGVSAYQLWKPGQKVSVVFVEGDLQDRSFIPEGYRWRTIYST